MGNRLVNCVTGLLAVVTLCGGAAVQAQLPAWPAPSADPAYDDPGSLLRLPPPGPDDQAAPISAGTAAAPGEKDLAARVSELEAALKRIKDKEEADKQKPPSSPSVRPIGRLHADCAAFTQNAALINQAGDFYNGAEFRRAWLGLIGEAFHVVDYKAEFDFAGSGQPAFRDTYITVKELPLLGNVRVGHFKELWGLEHLTGVNYVTFMERSLLDPSGGFCTVGDRKLGIAAFDWNEAETATWAVGAFVSQSGSRPPLWPVAPWDDAGGAAFDTRLTWLPWYDEATEGAGYLHTGIAYAYHDIAERRPGATASRFNVATKPEANLANNIIYAVDLNDVNRVNALRPEMCFTYGPFSIQGEYAWYFISRGGAGSPMFDGGYVQVSYFLTGEHRPYDRRRGFLTRVKPLENFFRVRVEDGSVQMGKGAWELAYRASYLNGSSGGILAGQAVDHTAGLNWYLNPYTRVMFNYVHSEVSNRNTNSSGIAQGAVYPTGAMDAFMTRFQIDF